MSPELQGLSDQVERLKTVKESAVALIKGLAAKLLAVKDDPAAITALSASLNSSATELSDAVVENTPAA